MSQLIARLERQLDASPSAIKRSELQGRLAIALARSGRFSEAHSYISSIRTEQGGGAGVGTLWAMLAEGVTQLYESIGPLALDRISRALLLGKALGCANVVAIAAAWKAHIHFEQSDFAQMAATLKLLKYDTEDVDLDAQIRSAIVLCNAFAFSGQFDQSRRWFDRGHRAAVQSGDQASIEALQYNRAALRLAWLRVERCTRPLLAEDLRTARIELVSAQGLQRLMRIGAYLNHLQLCAARLDILEQNYSDAIRGLQEVRNLTPFAKSNFSKDIIDLEIAYCEASQGNVDAAVAIYKPITDDVLASLDLDDRLVAVWMRSVLSTIRRDFCVEAARDCADALMEKLEVLRTELRIILADFELRMSQ